jgi:hypothetical protein
VVRQHLGQVLVGKPKASENRQLRLLGRPDTILRSERYFVGRINASTHAPLERQLRDHAIPYINDGLYGGFVEANV